MKKRILVPLDGSPLAEMVLPHAMALARAFGYDLVLLHVATLPQAASSIAWSVAPAANVWDGWDAELKSEGEYLEATADRLRSRGVDVTVTMVEDEPASGILAYAEQNPDVALVAMATHGRSGLSRWVFGSVAEKVLHASPVPLLLVRPGQGLSLADEFAIPEYRSLLVPLDGSIFAAQALENATTLAAALEARITLLSAVPDQVLAGEVFVPLGALADSSEEAQALKDYLRRQQERLQAEGLSVNTRLEYGPPAEAILDAAERAHADLIVMATHGRTGLPRLWLGSIAMRVMQAATRPVLLVRSKERVKEEAFERGEAAIAVAPPV
jgi:nucleotide-binding universal stress UspA family protein